MKITKYMVAGLVAACMSLTSCVDDLNVEPNDPDIRTTINSQEELLSVLASVYNDLVTGDGLSVSDGGAGSYTRCHFNLQEIVADECFISEKWNDPGYRVLNFNTWGNDNEWIYAAYSRENHLAKIASVFIGLLKEYGEKYGLSQEQIASMDAEARVLRGYANYCLIDLFGKGPWIDENSVTGAIPPTYSREELFNATVADLVAHLDQLLPAAKQEYGRVSREAGYMLLAKLYLNAGVYTGKTMWQECADALAKVVGTGISLAPEYKYLFCASNDKYVGNGEILWAVPQAVGFTESYGATTYLTAGCFMEAEEGDENLARQLRILNFPGTPWSGLRLRPELSQALQGDPRRLIYEGTFTEAIPDLAAYNATSGGFMLIKYTNTEETDYYNDKLVAAYDKWVADVKAIDEDPNLTDEQKDAAKSKLVEPTFNNASQMSGVDYPVFRLADAYLMLAECELRGAIVNVNGNNGKYYFDAVRARVKLPAVELNENTLLHERSCELYMEGHRRSDLIRFGLYTGSKYLWSWKGGEYTGASIPDTRALYPIPYQYVSTIGQNIGY